MLTSTIMGRPRPTSTGKSARRRQKNGRTGCRPENPGRRRPNSSNNALLSKEYPPPSAQEEGNTAHNMEMAC